jgi:hypothetical protein
MSRLVGGKREEREMSLKKNGAGSLYKACAVPFRELARALPLPTLDLLMGTHLQDWDRSAIGSRRQTTNIRDRGSLGARKIVDEQKSEWLISAAICQNGQMYFWGFTRNPNFWQLRPTADLLA